MKKVLLAATSLLAISTTAAFAADLPARTYTKAPIPVVAPVYNWGGFYIGANAGGGWNHNCWSITATGTPLGCHDADGAVAGGQIGYRWQSANWVFGLEAQGNWADIKGSHTSLLTPTQSLESKIDSFGLFTGQVGYAWNNALLYVKGGAAVTENKYRVYNSGLFAASAKDDGIWSATVGAGLEYGFAPNWSFGVEYNHIFIDTKNRDFFTPTGVYFDTGRLKNDVDLVTARVNYHFNWGGPILAKY